MVERSVSLGKNETLVCPGLCLRVYNGSQVAVRPVDTMESVCPSASWKVKPDEGWHKINFNGGVWGYARTFEAEGGWIIAEIVSLDPSGGETCLVALRYIPTIRSELVLIFGPNGKLSSEMRSIGRGL